MKLSLFQIVQIVFNVPPAQKINHWIKKQAKLDAKKNAPSSAAMMPIMAAKAATVAKNVVSAVEMTVTPATAILITPEIVPVKNMPLTTVSTWNPVGKAGTEFLSSQVHQVFIGIMLTQAQKASGYFFSNAMDYLLGSGTQREDHLSNLTTVVNESKEFHDKFEQVTAVLGPLVTNFHNGVKDQQLRLRGTEQSLMEQLQETERLEQILASIKVEDIETALENLMDRIGKVVEKHQNNIPIFIAAIDDLQEAEKDLCAAQSCLEATKQEFERMVSELLALEMLISLSGFEQDMELNTLIQRMDVLLNGEVVDAINS